MTNLGPFLGNPNEIYMGRLATEEPLGTQNTTVNNAKLNPNLSRRERFANIGKSLGRKAGKPLTAIKGMVPNLSLGSLGNAAFGLSALEAMTHTAAKARYDDPTVRADWQRFQDSNYLDPSAMPDIHDDYLSEDARQAIIQMAPAANALNLRKNHLDLLNGLANVAEEERALQNATQDLLANNAATEVVNDSRDPGTQAYLAQQAKNNTSTGNGNGSSVSGSSNALDPLMGLLGLLALGGGAYYLGKKL